MKKTKKQEQAQIDQERQEAWVGDAVLALFAREWLLENHASIQGEAFVRFTSNDFLRHRGNPTSVEAEIGRIYGEKGLEAAFEHMEKNLLPRFKELEKQRLKVRKPKK